ncbi:hypothetical protein KAX06_08150 [candidate division WOR-3 bacterium]|nr:hypothetical protein [candidate division WOR-3 bacterium]
MKEALPIACGSAVETIALAVLSVGFLGSCTPAKDFTFDSLRIDKNSVSFGDTVIVTAHVSGTGADDVIFNWNAQDGGIFTESSDSYIGVSDCSEVHWIAPDAEWAYRIMCDTYLAEPDHFEKTVEITVVAEE